MYAAANGAADTSGSASTDGRATNLWQRLLTVYRRALAEGAIYKTDTNDEVFRDPSLNVDFVLRVAASLRAKPRKTLAEQHSVEQPHDPFSPYEEALWVQHLSDTHTCLLNKFNVLTYHSLVVTRHLEHQTDPLNAADFGASLTVLRAMPQGGIAFYNCGPLSGSSQPHKHLQVVPLPLMPCLPAELPFEHILSTATAGRRDEVVKLRQLPYRAYAAEFDPDSVTGPDLEQLANRMLEACKGLSEEPLSYNVLLACRHLQIIPRSAEYSGPVAVNSLGPAGTFFVKTHKHLEYIKEQTPMKGLLLIVGANLLYGVNSVFKSSMHYLVVQIEGSKDVQTSQSRNQNSRAKLKNHGKLMSKQGAIRQ